MFFKRLTSQAVFTPDKMGKTTIVQGDDLFAGLNCFEPGQEHAPHSHDGQDKLYLVLEGRGIVMVGDHVEALGSGDAAFAPGGVMHSVQNPGPGRLIVMTILAPPPKR